MNVVELCIDMSHLNNIDMNKTVKFGLAFKNMHCNLNVHTLIDTLQ